jgi:tetratricopeptide (TPR) repeat protein
MKLSHRRTNWLLPVSGLFFGIACLLSYSRLNAKEIVLLAAVLCVYGACRLLRLGSPRTFQYLPSILLIFVVGQFYLSGTHPQELSWWVATVPGWFFICTVFCAGVLASVPRARGERPDHEVVVPENTDAGLGDLLRKAVPGVVVISTSLLLLVALNVDEVSPRQKLAPDYSMYVAVSFAIAVFFVTQTVLHRFAWGRPVLVEVLAAGVAAVLVIIGSVQTYRVITLYHEALRSQGAASRSQDRNTEVLWKQVLEHNTIPNLQDIAASAALQRAHLHMEEGDVQRASEAYDSVLYDDVFNFQANRGMADIALLEHEWERACRLFERLLFLKPDEPGLYPPYIHACLRDSKIDQAMSWVRAFKGNHPIPLEEPGDYTIIGSVLLKEQQPALAVAYLREAVRRFPEDARTQHLLGKALVESGRYGDGVDILESAVALNPEDAEGLYYLGIGYENTGRISKAVRSFQKAVTLDPNHIAALHHLEKLHADLGDEEKRLQWRERIERAATRTVGTAEWEVTSGTVVQPYGNMYGNGTVAAPVRLKDGRVTFVLHAMGRPALGRWPRMVVRLDENVIGTVTVDSRDLETHAFEHTVAPGTYTLSVSFVNEGVRRNKEGTVLEVRSLHVRTCEIRYEQ